MALRSTAVVSSLVLLIGLLSGEVRAQEPLAADSGDPSIVPLLVTGAESSHRAAIAMQGAADAKAVPGPQRYLPGASARLAEAATEMLDAAHTAGVGKSSLFWNALDRLKAAELLLQGGYELFADTPLARQLGLSEVLKRRASESIARWQSKPARLLAAAESLRVTPNAKAAELQLDLGLRALLPAATSTKVLGGTELPVHRPGLAPPALALDNLSTPSYADPQDPQPLTQDRLPSAGAQFSPGVLEKAQSLGYRYVELFDFVRTELRTEWSAGSTQSADRTLRRLAGNDVEQASLLIALLRASGAAARYVVGVVELPVADLAEQMGVPESQLARALTAAGIAHRPRVSGGQVVAYQIRHVWVSARVPYGNYRGSVGDTTEPTWIPLMPALKPAAFEPGTGVHSHPQQDFSSWLQAYLSSPQTVLPWPELRQRWASVLAALQPPIELSSLVGQHGVDASAIGLLPSSTPYPVIAVHAEYSVLPDEERQWLQVRLIDPEQPQQAPLLDARVALSDLISNRFTLAFLPATVEDQHITNANGSLGAFPLNLIRLRPSLMSEGVPAQPGRGEIVGGALLELEFELQTPNGSIGHRQRIHAGSIAGFAIDPHGDGWIEPAGVDAPSAIPPGGTVLNRFAERYLAESARAETESAALAGLRVIRPAPALALALPQVEAQGVAGLVESLEFKGVVLDAALRPLEPIALHPHTGLERDWLRLAALHGSALEAQLFEQLWGVPSTSADRLLQQAGAAVLELNAGADLTRIAAHADPIRAQVSQWLARGMRVHIAPQPQSVSAWSGSAWRVEDPETGASGYFLSGGYAGGATAVPPSLWFFQDLADLLANPYAEAPNEDPGSVALVQLLATSQHQTAEAGEVYGTRLAAFALDALGRPVVGAPLVFAIQGGDAELNGQTGSLSVNTDRRGLAEVTATAPTRRSGLRYLYKQNEDGFPVVNWVTEVEVMTQVSAGAIRSGTPFQLYMRAAPVAQLQWRRARGDINLLFHPDGSGFDGSGSPSAFEYSLPEIGHVSFLLSAFDRFGNPAGGRSAQVNLFDDHHPVCVAGAQGAINPSGLYTADSACPAGEPRLGGHACLARDLSLRLDAFGRHLVSVAPTNLQFTRVRILANANGQQAQTYLDVFENQYVNVPSETRDCFGTRRTYTTVELADPPAARVALAGQRFPLPRRFLSYVVTGLPARAEISPDLYGEPPPYVNRYRVRGGQASPLRTDGQGRFEFDVVAGEEPGRVEVYIPGQISSYEYEQHMSPGWSVQLDPPRIEPNPIPLNEFGRSESEVVFSSAIAPAEFTPDAITMEIVDAAGRVLQAFDSPFSAYSRVFPRGTLFDATTPQFLRYVVNPQSDNPLQSEAVPIRMSGNALVAYQTLRFGQPLPSLDSFVGVGFPRELEIQTEIDTQTDYICQAGSRFIFALGQPASVDLEFFLLDENGARSESALLALDNVGFEEGVFEEELDIERLPFGVYEFELRVRTDNASEAESGRLIHREKRRGGLALGRSLVKGVDVHDGHAVISEEDVAIGGRGPGLRFTRTYSSHSGDDQTVLGRGWNSDIDAQVVPDSCGSYVVTGAAGQGQRYVPDGTNADGSARFRSGNGFHGTFRLGVGPAFGYDFFSKDGTRYHFANSGSDANRLSFIEDPSGNRVQYEYGFAGTERVVTRMTDSAGRSLGLGYTKLRFERDSGLSGVTEFSYRTLLTSIVGPESLRVRYEYDGEGNLHRVKRCRGEAGQPDQDCAEPEEYTYHDFGGLWLRRAGEFRYYHMGYRITEAHSANVDSTREYAWGVGWSGLQLRDGSTLAIPEMRVGTLTETDGGTVKFAYNGLRPLQPTVTIVTDARDNASTYTMNRYGGTEQLVTPAGTTETEWDFNHLQPRAVTDALDTRTEWTYDTHGNRLSETLTHSAGRLTRSWVYVPPTAFDLPIKDRVRIATDARDIPTVYAYDERGRRTGQSRGGVTETYEYADNGDLSSYANGEGDLVVYGYDAYGHRSSESDEIGPRMSATFDARGRKLSERNGEGEETVYTYDVLDRLRSITHAAGARQIDYAQRIRTETDERRHTTTFVHDGQGRVLSEQNAADAQRLFTYDTNGNLLSETDFRGNLTEHSYDEANRRFRTVAPLQRTTVYEHNALGQIIRQRTQGGESAPREVQFAYAHPLNLPTLERHLISEGQWAETASDYDPNGNLILRTDPERRATVQVFDLRDRLVRIEAPVDRIETFSYDDADRRIGATLNTEPPQVRAWGFDLRGQQLRYTDATGARWEQGFDLAGRVIATINPLGATVTHSYDPAGRKIRESGPRAGQFVAYTLDAAGNRIGVSDAAGRLIVNTYDALNRLDTSTDADGLIERLGYDADGRVTSRENGRGEITGFDFNALGHEIGRTLPPNQAGARALVFTPGIHGELLAETDANRHTTTHSYDSLGRRISSQLPAVPDGGTLRSWRFDRVGNVLGHTDAAGRETTWTYSALNHRESQTDPSPPGTTQAWTYDVAGNVLSHTDRRGIVHTQRYDGENRVTERTRDALRIETLAYDLAGRVLSRTDARNEETRYTYDAGGSPLSETRALGFVQRWTYTPWGGVETQTDADGLTRGHVYDARQRLIEETDPAGQRTTHRYDLADNRILSTRPGNAEWRYAFDADRKLIEVESPEGHRSVYTHDRHGNRVEQRDAENTRTDFTYDARHRLRAIDHPVGGDESFAYNGEGELTAHTDRAGQAIAIERDGLGRVTERRYGAAETGDVHREVWTLDGDGQPTMLSQYGEPDGPHHVQRRFDGQGRLSQEDDRYSQRSRWTYDEVGNRLSLIDPAGTTTTAPDRLNRIARLSTDAGSTALSYSPAGRLQQITHPNGAVSDYTYDDAGRIERITHRQGNTEVARLEYTHDDRGNRREERRIDASGEQITTYEYDRDDRLTQVEVEDPQGIQTTTTYTLDAVGNREREEVRRGSTTVSDTRYTYQAHQRLIQTHDSISGITTEYDYDDRGHLISETTAGQTTTYRPNARDRLATLTLPGAPPVHYSYDAEGKRVERRTNTDLTRFGWDGQTLRRETNAANNVLEAHDWAAGRILASRGLTDTRYAQHDALRSPIRWSRSTGAEAGQLRYDAWGDTTASATDLPRIAYTGHYREREGTAYYAQQRYYRPGLGRFNRVDPWEGDVLNPITLNKYLYANGNPLAYIDPDGRIGIFVDGTGMDKDDPGQVSDMATTNVAQLYDLYGGDKRYLEGVGAVDDWGSQLVGRGFDERVTRAYQAIVNVYNDPNSKEEERQIDIFGFSRGAAIATALTKKLQEEGVPVVHRRQEWTRSNTWRTTETTERAEAQIRFVGLYDTVSARGVPTTPGTLLDLFNVYDPLSVDWQKVGAVRHAVAAREARYSFDLVSIRKCSTCDLPSNAREEYFLGAHSNVGGGYGISEGGNSLSEYPLSYMYREARAQGVPLADNSRLQQAIAELAGSFSGLLTSGHDSRYEIERFFGRQERTIYYGGALSARVEVLSWGEMMSRAYQTAVTQAGLVTKETASGEIELTDAEGR